MSSQNYALAVRAATLVGADNKKVPGATGVKAVLDVTAVPGGDTVQLVLEAKDPVSGKYVQMLAGVAGAGIRTDTLTIYPGITAAANVSLSDVLPDDYRFRVVHSAGTNFTYSVRLTELQ